jgi:hypothetical protein
MKRISTSPAETSAYPNSEKPPAGKQHNATNQTLDRISDNGGDNKAKP